MREKYCQVEAIFQVASSRRGGGSLHCIKVGISAHNLKRVRAQIPMWGKLTKLYQNAKMQAKMPTE
jgi:hypothetical protein